MTDSQEKGLASNKANTDQKPAAGQVTSPVSNPTTVKPAEGSAPQNGANSAEAAK